MIDMIQIAGLALRYLPRLVTFSKHADLSTSDADGATSLDS